MSLQSCLKYGKSFSLVCLIGITTCYSLTTSADVSVNNASTEDYIRRIQASHFLSQATMGPTIATTQALAARIKAIGRDAAFNEWIDDQFTKKNWSSREEALAMVERDGISPATAHQSHSTLRQSTRYYREHVWWTQTLKSEAQLLERMTWALYQIFPAYDRDARIGWSSNLTYMDLLKDNAFGNHRDLLEDITYSPMMGNFLSSLKNDKGDESLGIFPDENYAREVMQLFSIGVYDINNAGRFVTDGNSNRAELYTNEDISQIARVFTGLSLSRKTPRQTFYSASGQSDDGRMIMWEDHHHQGTKKFLGEELPAGQSGDQDISDTLDILINYHTTPYFISNLLMQRFTTSTPHLFYLQRVAQVYKDNGNGVRGDFKEVIRAILMDSTVRDSLKITTLPDPAQSGKTLIQVSINRDQWENDDKQGRLREPMLQLANFFRFFETDPLEHKGNTVHRGDFKPFHSELNVGQGIREKISVFGYYSADFLSVTGPAANKVRNGRPLVLPEFELLPTSAVELNEKINSLARNQSVYQGQTTNSIDAEITKLAEYADDPDYSVLIRDLNVYLFAGTMSQELQDALLITLQGISGDSPQIRLGNAIAVLLASPDFAVTN